MSIAKLPLRSERPQQIAPGMPTVMQTFPSGAPAGSETFPYTPSTVGGGVGWMSGFPVTRGVGTGVGRGVGTGVGTGVGRGVGCSVGAAVGSGVGDGEADGDSVGEAVGLDAAVAVAVAGTIVATVAPLGRSLGSPSGLGLSLVKTTVCCGMQPTSADSATADAQTSARCRGLNCFLIPRKRRSFADCTQRMPPHWWPFGAVEAGVVTYSWP